MSTRSRLLLGGLGAAGLLACTSACTGSGTTDSTPTASSRAGDVNRATRPADFTNGGFEDGDFTGWTVTTMLNGGVATFPPNQFSDLGLTAGGVNDTAVVSATTPGYPVPLGLTAADSLKYPYTNNDAAVLNSQGANQNTNVIEQSTTVLATDVDPSDGLVHARFAVAPVLQDPAHTGKEQPYFYLELLNTTTGASLFHTFNFSNQPGVSWIASSASSTVLYTNWKAFDIAPGSGAIRIGDTIHARVVAAGCSLGGHWGEIYLDQFGTTFPRPDVVVSAPAYANAGGALTYTVTAKNGGNGPATGTVVDFTLPTVADSSNANTTTAPHTAATTFASISTSGQTCTTPAVGASGTVTCTIGGLSPAGSSSFTVTVNLPTAASMSTWTAPVDANEGIYDIKTTQNPTPLTGGVVQTQITGLVPVDLEASLSDGVPAITWGSTDTYTYTVTNSSTSVIAAGTKVTDTAPTGFAVSGWSCAASAGSNCGTAAGTTGAINTTTGAIAANGVLTYTINGTWTGTGTTDATYSVTATPPAAYAQSVTFDNVGSDTDRLTSTTFPLTVNKTGNGDGLVVSSPAAIRCDVGCTTQSASYGTGETVALWAIAPSGQTFTGWSGAGCSGTISPCTVVLGAATTVTARFDEPSLVAAVTATSNGTGITDVRPGDTEDSTVTITVPDGQNAGLVLADTLPAGLTFVSATAPVVTGTIQCNGGVCTAPTQATSGQTSTWDFGVVTCTSVGGCTIAETVRGQTATSGASSVRGTVLTSTFAASAAKSATTAVTVDEPNMTLSEAASPASGVTRGQTTTVTATITNTGVATSGGYDAVASFPTPANTTPQNYKAGTCPAATPVLDATSATFTFSTSSTSVFPVGTSCTFSYDLLLGAAAPVGQTITIPGGTLTSASKATAPSKTYSITSATTSVLTSLLGAGATCATNNDCTDDVCDSDKKCGYTTGDGPCTPGADVKCRSGQCSKNGSCEPSGGCLEDADCDTSVSFCNTVTDSCTPKLLNGTPIPSIANHVPALTGLCTTGGLVGQAVCDTGVCDTDNECGLQLGDGTCTTDAECRAGVCVTTGANAGTCEICRDDTQCAGNASTKACDSTTNQCVSCTAANATACSGSSAFCNATTDTCTGCTGDNGSTATYACPSAAPYCDPDPTNGGACTTTCYADSDCGSGNWCDAGACTPKLPNGSPLPKVAGHMPELDGSCTVAIANSVCLTDSCDPTLLVCGFANGEGPCTDSAQCGNGVCVTSGSNAGKCEPCFDDSTCGGATPVCNTVTNVCAACGASNSTTCAGVTPVCNTSAFLCVACAGDFGTSTTFACDQANPDCNTETGACGTFCSTDVECGTGRWCDASACTAKLPNGTPIPVVTGHTPGLTGVCSSPIGQLLCLSGTCDPKTNVCGISLGDACTSDSECPTGDACTGGFCAVGNGTGGGNGAGADGGTTGGGTGTGTGTDTSGDTTGTKYDVLGGGCTLGPDGAGSSGADLGFLVSLVGIVTRRRRKASASAATSKQESV